MLTTRSTRAGAEVGARSTAAAKHIQIAIGYRAETLRTNPMITTRMPKDLKIMQGRHRSRRQSEITREMDGSMAWARTGSPLMRAELPETGCRRLVPNIAWAGKISVAETKTKNHGACLQAQAAKKGTILTGTSKSSFFVAFLRRLHDCLRVLYHTNHVLIKKNKKFIHSPLAVLRDSHLMCMNMHGYVHSCTQAHARASIR